MQAQAGIFLVKLVVSEQTQSRVRSVRGKRFQPAVSRRHGQLLVRLVRASLLDRATSILDKVLILLHITALTLAAHHIYII